MRDLFADVRAVRRRALAPVERYRTALSPIDSHTQERQHQPQIASPATCTQPVLMHFRRTKVVRAERSCLCRTAGSPIDTHTQKHQHQLQIASPATCNQPVLTHIRRTRRTLSVMKHLNHREHRFPQSRHTDEIHSKATKFNRSVDGEFMIGLNDEFVTFCKRLQTGPLLLKS